jgi:hypothetical protein
MIKDATDLTLDALRASKVLPYSNALIEGSLVDLRSVLSDIYDVDALQSPTCTSPERISISPESEKAWIDCTYSAGSTCDLFVCYMSVA